MKGDRPTHGVEYRVLLLAIVLVGICFYGIRAAAVYGLAAATAVLTDLLCLFLRRRAYRRSDLEHVDAALVMAMMFPATVPYSIVLLSTVIAVAVGVHVFGSRGTKLLPPAAVGYLFAYLCWSNELLRFPEPGKPLPLFGGGTAEHGSLVSALYSGAVLRVDRLDLMIGNIYAPMGAGCVLLLIVGGIVLLLRRQVRMWPLVGYLIGAAAAAPAIGLRAMPVLMTGMVLFSGIFLIADCSVVPGRSVLTMPVGVLAGAVTVYLAAANRPDAAPVITAVLSSPFWYAAAAAERRLIEPAVSEQEVQDAQQND